MSGLEASIIFMSLEWTVMKLKWSSPGPCQYPYIITVHIIGSKSDPKCQILHLYIDGCEMSSDERIIYLLERCGI
jgi:hypothetical protein